MAINNILCDLTVFASHLYAVLNDFRNFGEPLCSTYSFLVAGAYAVQTIWILLTAYYVWLLLVKSKPVFFSWKGLSRDVGLATLIGFSIAGLAYSQKAFGNTKWFCGFKNAKVALFMYSGTVLSVLVIAGYFYMSTVVRVWRVRKPPMGSMGKLAGRLMVYILACIIQWATYMVFLVYEEEEKQVSEWLVYTVIFFTNSGGLTNAVLYARFLGRPPAQNNYREKPTERSTVATNLTVDATTQV
jgi:hypothetical protein